MKMSVNVAHLTHLRAYLSAHLRLVSHTTFDSAELFYVADTRTRRHADTRTLAMPVGLLIGHKFVLQGFLASAHKPVIVGECLWPRPL